MDIDATRPFTWIEHLVSTEWKIAWNSEAVWKFSRKEKHFFCAENQLWFIQIKKLNYGTLLSERSF